MAGMALESIDDSVVLLDERPVKVEDLWSVVLQSMAAGHRGVTLVHPFWWPTERVDVVRAAARTLPGGPDAVEVRTRRWLLTRAVPPEVQEAEGVAESVVLVEFWERLAVVTGDEAVAVMHGGASGPIVEEVARAAGSMPAPALAPVLIDAASAGAGAQGLAKSVAESLRTGGHGVVEIDGARLARLAGTVARTSPPNPRAPLGQPGRPARCRAGPRAVIRRGAARFVAAGAVATGLAILIPELSPVLKPTPRADRTHSLPVVQPEPTTLLVEGSVAMTVPADWSTQRVVSGGGSARVQVTSPSDPEVALHLTQTPTPGETLAGAAEQLRRAIQAGPAGVFVDFDPSGLSAGRPAVTYREVRTAHHVRWTVLVDRLVRIGIGCQSPPAADDAVRRACDRAVASAHSVG